MVYEKDLFMSEPAPYRYILERGQKVKVDHESSCHDQHEMKSPPMFHVARSEKFSPFLVRCPRSLSPEERATLKP